MRGTDIPLYRWIADDFRRRITTGELPPGTQLPSEPELGKRYAAARETVRSAMRLLRAEGLLVMRRGYGTFVRQDSDRQAVQLVPGERVITRMPTPDERRDLDLEDGVPVLEVTGAGNGGRLYAGDRTVMTCDR
ncbi:MAG TPA: GntR family transcriptional regulator [Rugosimonospora sp.]|nr:GntR family transcriptional regulator [Rugosimonospora sp.]